MGFRKATISFALAASVVVSGLGTALLTPVSAEEATAKEVAPLALYEFKDESNIGKDSMGKYDLTFRNEWMAGGTGPLLNEFTMEEGGGISFNNKFCIASDDDTNVFKGTSAVTMVLEVKINAGSGNWGHIAGTGVTNAAKNSLTAHSAADGANQVRIASKGIEGLGGCWGSLETVNGDTTSYHKIVISAQPEGKLRVWKDGVIVSEDKDVPADWTAYDTSNMFSIGAEYNGAAGYSSAAALKSVAVYGFAMDETAAKAWGTNRKVTETDVAGLKTVKSVSDVSFGDNEATKNALNVGMSDAEMLAELNDATAKLTFSDESTQTVAVDWTKVEKEDGKYYAVGSVNTVKLGYACLTDNTVKYELSVASVKSISAPVFEGDALKDELKDSMSEADMLALINGAKVTVTMANDSTKEVDVTFTKIDIALGVYTAIADVTINGENVGSAKYVLTVTQTNEGNMRELLPIAKYEFEDSTNTGKDSMGNYNLGATAKSGGDLTDPWGTGTIDDGRLYVNGSDVLSCESLNDVGDNISNGFTLNFQYQQEDLTHTDWISPISFGFDDWDRGVSCAFLISGGSDALRVSAAKVAYNEADGNIYWAPVVVEHGTTQMNSVTLSVRPGDKFNVYVNGVLAFSKDCPADFTIKSDTMSFAIGGECAWGNGYNKFKGWIDNVSIYNFAMSLDQSNAFWQKGKVVVGDMDGEVITSISDTPAFANGSYLAQENKGLNDRLTNTQAVRRVSSATVDAVFANEDTIQLPVTWKELKKEDDKWYIVGVVDTSNLGYATTLEGSTEVKYEVEVARQVREVSIDSSISNGSVTADKTEAYLGDAVTLTVTPADGYKIGSVTVNGEALEAGADGKYVYTVEGIEDVEISATFVEISSGNDNSSANGSNGTSDSSNAGGVGIDCSGLNCSGSIGGGLAFVSMAVAAAAVVLLKKKEN